MISRRNRRRLGIGAIAAVLLGAAGFAAIRPSNHRDWVSEWAVMPKVVFQGDTTVRRGMARSRTYVRELFVIADEHDLVPLRAHTWGDP